MAWDEEDYQQDINRRLANPDLSEVVVEAIDIIVSGKIALYHISIGGPVNCTTDPAQDVSFGEQLLRAAIDKLREKK